jgi:adenylyl-sulfate kinase
LGTVDTEFHWIPASGWHGEKQTSNLFQMIIWLTGLSGAGKSTLADGLATKLRAEGIHPLMIDGDGLREELCRDLGFSAEDRMENIRRAGAIALLAARSGITSICSLISPLRSEREAIRGLCQARDVAFIEVYVSTPLSTCEGRDPKGLYKKARAGMIPKFTGIDSPYESPLNPELEIPTHELTIEESVGRLHCAVKKLE